MKGPVTFMGESRPTTYRLRRPPAGTRRPILVERGDSVVLTFALSECECRMSEEGAIFHFADGGELLLMHVGEEADFSSVWVDLVDGGRERLSLIAEDAVSAFSFVRRLGDCQ